MAVVVNQLRLLSARTYLRVFPIAAVGALMIGIPSDLIRNPVFGRPVPIRTIDYVIWAITSLLIGLVFAIRPEKMNAADAAADEQQQSRAIWGGFVSFLAVGCPVCNQLVVAAVGASGALSWWAPVQPFVGLAAIGLLLWALKKRLDTYELTSCPLPVNPTADVS